MKETKLFILLVCCSLISKAQHKQYDATPLHRLQNALVSVTINDNISPVVASRIFVYPNLAFYNAITDPSKIKNSLRIGKADHKPNIVTAIHAYATVARSMIYTREIFEDSLKSILASISEMHPEGSEKEGIVIGQEVIRKMKEDGFQLIRSMPKYSFNNDESTWRPTAPGYFQAVEPNWGKIKPLLAVNLKFDLFKPLPYDTSRNSVLYKEALEVYNISKSSVKLQKEIAAFWDCNPFALHLNGHKMMAEKKISPVGHWICIAQSILRQKGLDASAASYVYTTLSAGMFDALIYCWDLKYKYSFIRPEHFITKYIDPDWEPLLQSPPFPEFPSGHSVISATAAEILNYHFGNIPYEDSTEIRFGIAPRKFNSFFEASDEAAISRVFGGIHFRHAAEQGKTVGSIIGKTIIQSLKP
jgi:hypothetical protein